MKTAFSILLSVFILSSCTTPNALKRRAQRHIAKAVRLDPTVLTGVSSIKVDTLIITEEKFITDTVVLRDVDSVIVEKDNVVTKIWRKYDTLRVETICPPDSFPIYIEKDCPPQVKHIKETFWQMVGRNVIWISIILVILVIAFFTIRWLTSRLY